MKLKGISDTGMKRLAQMRDETGYSGGYVDELISIAKGIKDTMGVEEGEVLEILNQIVEGYLDEKIAQAEEETRGI